MTYIATAALLLTGAVLIPVGGVLFAPFLLGVFLLALVGVLAGETDRRVRRQGDDRSWRSCE